MKRSLRHTDRQGLTLLELVVVLAVLAALAAVIVPKLDFVKAQADHATAAANSADLTTMIQTQRTATGFFPTLDSLVDSSGAILPKFWTITGPSASPFTATTITGPGAPALSDWYRSFLEGGLTTAFVQASAPTDASNSATTTINSLADLAAAGSLTVAELNYSVSGGTHPYLAGIVSRCFPGQTTPPAGVKLIAMGIGPNNSMIGTVMTSTPMETQGDDSKAIYCRHIAIFAIYQSGKPATLKMVVDHRLKQIDRRVDQFNAAGPGGT